MGSIMLFIVCVITLLMNETHKFKLIIKKFQEMTEAFENQSRSENSNRVDITNQSTAENLKIKKENSKVTFFY